MGYKGPVRGGRLQISSRVRGASQSFPPQNGGRLEQVLAMLKMGDTTSFGVVLTWVLKMLAMPKEGIKNVHVVKGRGATRFTLS